MALHSSDKSRARLHMGKHLAAHGWTLHGYKEGHRTGHHDFEPERWQGVASKYSPGGDYVFVMLIKPGSGALENSRKGYNETYEPGEQVQCEHCSGDGLEPGGWTYEEAKADPVTFNTQHGPEGTIPLTPNAISPFHFKANREKCKKCHGLGYKQMPPTLVQKPWPKHKANPKGAMWHVEQCGTILQKGVGISTIYDNMGLRGQSAEENAACDNIRRRCEPYYDQCAHAQHNQNGRDARTITMGTEDNLTLTLSYSEMHDGIELRFNRKPDDYQESIIWIREMGIGFRWSRRQGLWYTKYTDGRWQTVNENMDVLETIERLAEIETGDDGLFPAQREAAQRLVDDYHRPEDDFVPDTKIPLPVLAHDTDGLAEIPAYVPPPGIKIEKFKLVPDEHGRYVPCDLEVITNPADDDPEMVEEVVGEKYTIGTKENGKTGLVPTGEKITRKRKKLDLERLDLAIDASYGRTNSDVVVIVDWSRVSRSLHPKLLACGVNIEDMRDKTRWRYGFKGAAANRVYKEVVEVIVPYLEAVSLGKGKILEVDDNFRSEIEVAPKFGETLEVAGVKAQQGSMF